jgi:hypothetical protein
MRTPPLFPSLTLLLVAAALLALVTLACSTYVRAATGDGGAVEPAAAVGIPPAGTPLDEVPLEVASPSAPCSISDPLDWLLGDAGWPGTRMSVACFGPTPADTSWPLPPPLPLPLPPAAALPGPVLLLRVMDTSCACSPTVV